MNFRKDINGLRAFAVLAVVLFHFKIRGFNGGFSGVDIFFVISGYLMTGIIFSKIRNNKFSIIEFYLHRARRIIPALAILCLILLIFSFYFLLYNEVRDVIGSVKNSIKFTSNITYYKETDYFATQAQYNWLLHTWSLSVEWQFYLIYPIVISIFYKFFSEKIAKIILIFALIVSLGLSIFYTPVNSSASFYLLPTRAWEMLAGGIIFLYPITINKSLKRLLCYSGIVLIVLAVLILQESMLWPSYLATIPVIGTMLVLLTNHENSLTDNFICQFIGKISYSVYLWHWPIVVFLKSCGLLSNIAFLSLGIILSFIIGTISYYLIEKRFKLNHSKLIESIKYIFIVIFVIGAAAGIGKLLKLYPNLQNKIDAQFIENATTKAEYTGFFKTCISSSKGFSGKFYECKYRDLPPSIIVMGDSHAINIFPAIEEINTNKGTILWESHGCPVMAGFTFTNNRTDECNSFLKQRFNELATKYKNVPLLVINRYSIYVNAEKGSVSYLNFDNKNNLSKGEYLNLFSKNYTNTMCELSKNRPVYILKPIPEMSIDVPKYLYFQSIFTNSVNDIGLPLEKYENDYKFITDLMDETKKQCNIHLLDPKPYLCSNNKECKGSIDGKPLYSDDNHLNISGGKLLTPLFRNILNQ